ncbi:MAG: phosphoribosyltransferase [Actinobacteria bacterium]|nr:phosphoribosyltransferase [Actinomycetota bacterium]
MPRPGSRATRAGPSMGGAMFVDRSDAGDRLAEALRERLEGPVVVLGIPRGGVLVAEAVARALDAPLDVVVPRKIGAPQNPELAIGAIAPGVQVWDPGLIGRLGVNDDYMRREVEVQEAEIARRTEAYRGGRPPLGLEGRTVVVVDDGLATGATAVAACHWVRRQGAARVVLAVPVAPPEALGRLEDEADEVVALRTPFNFFAVGEWYGSFEQTSDDEVVTAMARAAGRG